jgi:hypothetical protein
MIFKQLEKQPIKYFKSKNKIISDTQNNMVKAIMALNMVITKNKSNESIDLHLQNHVLE